MNIPKMRKKKIHPLLLLLAQLFISGVDRNPLWKSGLCDVTKGNTYPYLNIMPYLANLPCFDPLVEGTAKN